MRTPTPPSRYMMDLCRPFCKLFGQEYPRFLDHMTCLLTSPDPCCITEVARCATESRDYSRHRDFLAYSAVSDADLCRVSHDHLFSSLDCTTTLSDGRQVIVTVSDDTVRRRPYGPRLFGCGFHYDHAPAPDQKCSVWGQSLVVHGVVPDALNPAGAQAILSDIELYTTLDQSLESGVNTLPYESKMSLVALMLSRQRQSLGPEAKVIELVDALYMKSPFLNQVCPDPNLSVIGKLAHNRALFDMPPARKPGQVGRPKTYGERLYFKDEIQKVDILTTLTLYGQPKTMKIWSKVGLICGYQHPVLFVAVQWVNGSKKSKPILLCATDISLKPEDVVCLYAARFSVEEAIKDCVIELGMGHERSRKKEVYLRQLRLKILAQIILKIQTQKQPKHVREALRDPWRKTRPRLTMGQLRKGLWWECLTGKNLFRPPDPKRPDPQNSITPKKGKKMA